MEIVDIYHAYSYRWAVGHALCRAEATAAAWVEPLNDQLYTQGTAPVLATLASLPPTTEEAGRAIMDAQAYFTQNGARMDYP